MVQLKDIRDIENSEIKKEIKNNMKQKISITIDEETLKLIENILKESRDAKFRNRSHVIEYSLRKFLNENLNKLER